jgi:hypothetical protein
VSVPWRMLSATCVAAAVMQLPYGDVVAVLASSQ